MWNSACAFSAVLRQELVTAALWVRTRCNKGCYLPCKDYVQPPSCTSMYTAIHLCIQLDPHSVSPLTSWRPASCVRTPVSFVPWVRGSWLTCAVAVYSQCAENQALLGAASFILRVCRLYYWALQMHACSWECWTALLSLRSFIGKWTF